MNQIDSMEILVNEFSKLPSVGKKTAQRYAYHLLTMTESEVQGFAEAMINAKQKIHYCKICSNFTDKEVCDICAKTKFLVFMTISNVLSNALVEMVITEKRGINLSEYFILKTF